MKKPILSFLLLFFTITATFGQYNFSYGTNAYYGAVFRYKKDMPKLLLTNLYGGEVYFNKQTNGTRFWEAKYNYPKLGISAAYYNYGVPEELGSVYLANGYLDFTFSSRMFNQLRMNLGTGLVYSDKIYDRETNPANKAIGARVSYILSGTIYYHHRINKHWRLNLNAAFRHFSNGRTNMPNNGMNFPVVGIGVEYFPSEEITFLAPVAEEFDKKLHFNIYGATAWREVLAEDHKHKAYSLSTYFSKRITWYNSVLLGVDAFYYTPESLQKHLAVDGFDIGDESIDGRQLAITVGNELFFGRTSLVMQAGFYTYLPYPVWARWYQRYGLKFSVTRDAFLQVSLISHTRTANMIEWGAGLSL